MYDFWLPIQASLNQCYSRVSNTFGAPTSFQEGNTEVQNDSGNKRPDNVGGPIQEVVGPSDDNVDDSMEDLDDIADNDDIPDDSNKQQVVKDIEDELESEDEEEVSFYNTSTILKFQIKRECICP